MTELSLESWRLSSSSRPKAATYAGNGKVRPADSSGLDRPLLRGGRSHLSRQLFGSGDFIGEEVVWHLGDPIWAIELLRLHPAWPES